MTSIIASIFAISLVAVGAGYKPVAHKEGVDIYAKDSPITDLVAVGEFDAPPHVVQAALVDYADHPGLIKHLAQSRVLSRKDGEMTVYEYLKLPVVKDRDYAIHVTWKANEATGLQFAIDPGASAPTSPKAVRMNTLSGRWELEPINDGRGTRAMYHVLLDLGGSISPSTVRNGTAKELPAMFVAMRHLAAQRQLGTVAASR